MKIPFPAPFNHSLAILLVTSLLVATFLYGCDEDDATHKQIDKLDFQIVFLDENQNADVVFADSFDVRIGLKIENNSAAEIQWRYDYTCGLFQNEDFLIVYKKNESIKAGSSNLPLGKPYESPVNCYTINLPPQSIFPGENILINLPWSTNPINKPLGPGMYYSSARFSLEIENNRKIWDLRNDFEIK
jgi:hypothetical protein